jgi:tetratricopeptide (TPR) repeat protein
MAEPSQILSELIKAFNQGNWSLVQQLAARLLPLMPHQSFVCYIAGVAHMEFGEMPQALELLRKAAYLEPQRADFVTQFAKALALMRLTREARCMADQALALSPDDAVTLSTLGVVYTHVHSHEQAALAFRRAVAIRPDHALYRFNLATSLVAAGDIVAAVQELEESIQLDSRYWRAHLMLAQVWSQTTTDNHIHRLRKLLAENEEDTEAQIQLNMALGTELENTVEYPEAFRCFSRGKSVAKASRGYSVQSDEALFSALKAVTPERHVAAGDPSNEPIFVFGMPRTGTTLLERIISSHPDVHSAGEMQNFGMAFSQVAHSESPLLLDPDVIARAKQIDWRLVGKTYLASTRPGTGHTPRFIDKLPHNFLYAGLIAQALPNARMICLRRDPLDTCLSNFRQLFARGSPYYGYSFDLLDIGRYYIMFDRLMAHWQRAFPGRILEMEYESLIESQESSSRQLLEFCDLPWSDACLEFENNPAPVHTASAMQVREPVYRTALKRWKKYEPQLGELMKLLTDAGIPLVR